MTLLKFKGAVEQGDSCRVGNDDDGAVRIGGRDVVGEVSEAWPERTKLLVSVADERFEGDLAFELGWGYSEYTPMDSDTLSVGPHDLIAILLRHEGKSVTLWLSDEVINLRDESAGV